MTTYVKIPSANYPTHYQSFQFSSHLQYNTLLHSPSQVFYNGRNSWYFSPIVISKSTDFFVENAFLYKNVYFKTCFFHEGQSLISTAPTKILHHCSTISGLSEMPIRSSIIFSLGKLQELEICYLKIGLYT